MYQPFNSEGEVLSLSRARKPLKAEPLHNKPSILNFLPHTFARRDSPFTCIWQNKTVVIVIKMPMIWNAEADAKVWARF